MICVVQRVTDASVVITSRTVSNIAQGLLIFLGIAKGDSQSDARQLAEKIVRLRIFEDENGKMNRSLLDIQGAALVVSQFTLLANTERGRRPGFEDAAPPDQAEPLYECFVEQVRSLGVEAQTGVFGADMRVGLTNDGPVTLIVAGKSKPSRK